MAVPQSKRDYCCCFPLRVGVFIISLIALLMGAYSVYMALSNKNTDSTEKIINYVIAGIYVLLGVSGVASVAIKTYGLAKNFSVLWWSVTIVGTILSVIDIILVATKYKENLRAACRSGLEAELRDEPYTSVGMELGVDSCYSSALMMMGVALAIRFLVMSFCGWVASRYTTEVKHQHDHREVQGAAPVIVEKA